MVAIVVQKIARAVRPWLQDKRVVLAAAIFILALSSIVYSTFMSDKRLTVDRATYAPLLQLIAKAESSGNYNAYFGNAGNDKVTFTDMTIADVQKWQAEHIKQGSPSSAVGRYQILNTTLAGLVDRLGIDTKLKFDAAMQDALAIALIERRGAEEYINDELTRDEFAHNLAKEWAGLPRVIGDKPGDSFYASDGLNKSRVSVDEVRKAIEPISPK